MGMMFDDFVNSCSYSCSQCELLNCPKIPAEREPVSAGKLAERVNEEVLDFIADVSKRHATVLFLFTGINEYACNLPEVCTIFHVTSDELDSIEEFYDDHIEMYVSDFGVAYDGMTMVTPNMFDVSWLSSDQFCFFVQNGQFYIQTKL